MAAVNVTVEEESAVLDSLSGQNASRSLILAGCSSKVRTNKKDLFIVEPGVPGHGNFSASASADSTDTDEEEDSGDVQARILHEL